MTDILKIIGIIFFSTGIVCGILSIYLGIQNERERRLKKRKQYEEYYNGKDKRCNRETK